jgi:hypothetical protein
MIKVGSKVKCLNTIKFIDGTFHFQGQVYIVQKNTIFYYQVNSKHYQIIEDENI